MIVIIETNLKFSFSIMQVNQNNYLIDENYIWSCLLNQSLQLY